MNKKDIQTFNGIRKKLLKVAQDELEMTEYMPSGEAGPQEVVDAVANIANELEDVLKMIPAEPHIESEDMSEKETIVAENEMKENNANIMMEEDPEKKLMQSKIASLEKQLDNQNKDVVANKIAHLYGGDEVVYNKIMSSDKPSSFHVAQLETLEDFIKNSKTEDNTPNIAQNFSSYLKVAQTKKPRRMML